MLNQQKADTELLQLLGKSVSLLLMVALLTILGVKYFHSVDKVGAQNLEVDHTKLIHLLSMVKAQWFSQGRPALLNLEWDSFEDFNQHQQVDKKLNLIKMSDSGWPLLNQRDKLGCKQLWKQLLGRETERQSIVTDFDASGGVCHYISEHSGQLSYELNSGRVTLLTKD
ncbi:hypothetical protein HQQ94_04295 [Shewanella sp. VB17]|uniref:hypothetical protein n=1 Tax=Shewanella sp. VB17 TaxID=2739432 RepID=UPI0015661CB5|nr:hypothetical protein [Shewanella sp. VB17]NRD72478.1 hypothetical protein [Shewanella sp. VB17]